MANYTTGTSDKSKSRALKLFYCGGFGILGLHYFYVGRYKRGFVHLAIAVFSLVEFGVIWFAPASSTSTLPATFGAKFGMTLLWLLALAAINIPTFIRLKSGAFRDNVGAPLREK